MVASVFPHGDVISFAAEQTAMITFHASFAPRV